MHVLERDVSRCCTVYEYRVLEREGSKLCEVCLVSCAHTIVKLFLYVLKAESVLVKDEPAAV